MKKLLLILLCLPMIGFGQKTYVPDDNFEQALINLGYDNILDDSVTTSNINTVTTLTVSNKNISDLTGIQDFAMLKQFWCENNNLTSLDLSHNDSLYQALYCHDNQLTYLNIQNGVNKLFWGDAGFKNFCVQNNPLLTCIIVDDSIWATINFWSCLDPQHYFSTNCSGTTDIQEHYINKGLLKVTDILGQETPYRRNTPLLYIYDDGTVEKKIIIE